jgi:hypothetical protein
MQLKKCLSLILIALLASLIPARQVLASSSDGQQTPLVEKIKAKIAKRGVGEKARVEIKLRNGKTIKGYVSSAGQDDFRLTDRKTGQTTTVAYADVVEVKNPGLSNLTKVAVFVGIGVAVVITIAVIQFRRNCCF